MYSQFDACMVEAGFLACGTLVIIWVSKNFSSNTYFQQWCLLRTLQHCGVTCTSPETPQGKLQ